MKEKADQTISFAKVDAKIAQGKLGAARDHLRCLLRMFPYDYELRIRLGDVNFQLGYPIEAGRFWIIVNEPTEIQKQCIDQFVGWCKCDPITIWSKLLFPGHCPQTEEGLTPEYLSDLYRSHFQNAPYTIPVKGVHSVTDNRRGLFVFLLTITTIILFVLFVLYCATIGFFELTKDVF